MPVSEEHTVGLVVDPNFGQGLYALVERMHVWVVDRPANRKVAEALWADLSEEDRGNLQGPGSATTFLAAEGTSPEDICVGVLPSIDEHHGIHSAETPWNGLEAYGVELTDAVRQALLHLGFEQFETTPGGFVCHR